MIQLHNRPKLKLLLIEPLSMGVSFESYTVVCTIIWREIFGSSGRTVLFLTKFDYLIPIDKIDGENDDAIICDDIHTRKTLIESENTIL